MSGVDTSLLRQLAANYNQSEDRSDQIELAQAIMQTAGYTGGLIGDFLKAGGLTPEEEEETTSVQEEEEDDDEEVSETDDNEDELDEAKLKEAYDDVKDSDDEEEEAFDSANARKGPRINVKKSKW